jgi:hypothetical protein
MEDAMVRVLLSVGLALIAACEGDRPSAAQGMPVTSPPPPALTSMNPTSGPVETMVTLTGSGFKEKGNAVKFGDGYVRELPSEDGKTLKFAVPDGLDRCSPGGTPCPGGYARVKPGAYEVSVVTAEGSSASITFTVTE